MINIAVLVSGGGTNLQALIDAQQAGKIENGRIALVVSSNPNACCGGRISVPQTATQARWIRCCAKRASALSCSQGS